MVKSYRRSNSKFAGKIKEEYKMNEAIIVIVLAAFLFGMIMGLALGKTNK